MTEHLFAAPFYGDRLAKPETTKTPGSAPKGKIAMIQFNLLRRTLNKGEPVWTS